MRRRLVLLSLFAAFGVAPAQERVSITVDVATKRGPMNPMWAWFGYDEPNYTYMADGKKLL